MKQTVFVFFMLFALTMGAGNVNIADSLQRELGEVVVQGAPVVRKADKYIYTVTGEIKDRSSSAMDLIKNIQIPNLNVNEVMDQMSSSLGSVQVRVNGRETDIEKLKAINYQDIQRIEWIDNPGLRYGTDVGAVLNLIVNNPTSGGALNLSFMESFTMWFNNSFMNLTLNKGRSQWIVSAWGSVRNKLQMYREYEDAYHLPDGTIIERT